jgi:hypothetical protein
VPRYRDTTQKVIKDNKQATVYWLIATRSPKIRGWANLHRHAAAKKPFVHVDTAILKALWRWARRRHPKKGKQWGKDRDFGRLGNQHGRFFGKAKDKEGNTSQHGLCLASATTINAKYPQIKGLVTPTTRHGNSILQNALASRWQRPCGVHKFLPKAHVRPHDEIKDHKLLGREVREGALPGSAGDPVTLGVQYGDRETPPRPRRALSPGPEIFWHRQCPPAPSHTRDPTRGPAGTHRAGGDSPAAQNSWTRPCAHAGRAAPPRAISAARQNGWGAGS